MNLTSEKRSGVFSENRAYRYTLKIVWDESLSLCQFIGLNPSTADEIQDDPTLRRCKGFARSWGFGGIVMTNLFAFRDTDPEAMKAARWPIGETLYCHEYKNRNDFWLRHTHGICDLTVAAWGNHGAHLDRATCVAGLLSGMKCFRLTMAGQPEHPLYMPRATPLIDFN